MRKNLNPIVIIGSNNRVTVNYDQSGENSTPTEPQVENNETPERKHRVSKFLPAGNLKFFVLIVLYELLNSVLPQYFAV